MPRRTLDFPGPDRPCGTSAPRSALRRNRHRSQDNRKLSVNAHTVVRLDDPLTPTLPWERGLAGQQRSRVRDTRKYSPAPVGSLFARMRARPTPLGLVNGLRAPCCRPGGEPLILPGRDEVSAIRPRHRGRRGCLPILHSRAVNPFLRHTSAERQYLIAGPVPSS